MPRDAEHRALVALLHDLPDPPVVLLLRSSVRVRNLFEWRSKCVRSRVGAVERTAAPMVAAAAMPSVRSRRAIKKAAAEAPSRHTQHIPSSSMGSSSRSGSSGGCAGRNRGNSGANPIPASRLIIAHADGLGAGPHGELRLAGAPPVRLKVFESNAMIERVRTRGISREICRRQQPRPA